MKRRIRKAVLEKRRNHLARHAQNKSLQIQERLLDLPEIQHAGVVMLYYPLPQEADCLGAARKLLADGKKIVFPKVVANKIVPVAVKDLRKMRKGTMDVMEPAKGKKIDSKEIDVVVVPGVAFDLRGHRLGFGGGHYDRFLKSVRKDCAKIGLAFELQLLEKLPAEAHDVRMDAVVTEKRVIRRGG